MREASVPSLYDPPARVNVADVVFEYADTHGSEVAYSRRADGRWRDVTFAEFAHDVLRLARGLVAAGLQPGDRVGLMSRTRYEWGVIDFAVQAVRGVVVPVHETSSLEQTEWILGSTGTRMVFVETSVLAEAVSSIRGTLPALTDLWVIDDGALTELSANGAGVSAQDVTELRSMTDADDDATIVFTRPSAGRPKGCRLTHANLVSNARNMIGILGDFTAPGSTTLLFLPLADLFARTFQLGAFTARAKAGHEPDVSALSGTLTELRPTFLLATPSVLENAYTSVEQEARNSGRGPIFGLIARTAITWSRAKSAGRVPPHATVLRALLNRLIGTRLHKVFGGRCRYCICVGAPLDARLWHFFRGTGIEVIEAYGMTETSPVATLNTQAHNRVGTVGRPVPGSTVRIADDGELLVKGANVFKGYWRSDDETTATLRDGWLYTGDLATLDDEGCVTITGRKKDIIATAGGNDAPVDDDIERLSAS